MTYTNYRLFHFVIGTVSYTHLDVYKRQEQKITRKVDNTLPGGSVYVAEFDIRFACLLYTSAENTFINPYYLVDIFIMNPALILIAVAQSLSLIHISMCIRDRNKGIWVQ